MQKRIKSNINDKRDIASKQRKTTQPLTYRSAGSIFKNPKENAAGYLIDKAGLKGLQIGGAKISEKHANFIVNLGNAKSTDVLELIDVIKNKIYQMYKIKLELEIKSLENYSMRNIYKAYYVFIFLLSISLITKYLQVRKPLILTKVLVEGTTC